MSHLPPRRNYLTPQAEVTLCLICWLSHNSPRLSTQAALMMIKIGITVSYMKLHPAPGNGEKISPFQRLSSSPYLLCLHTSSMFTSLQSTGGQKYVLDTDLPDDVWLPPLVTVYCRVFVIKEPLAIRTPLHATLHALISSILRAESSLNCLEIFT